MASKSVKRCVSVWENNNALFEGLLIIKEKELKRSDLRQHKAFADLGKPQPP